MELIPTKSKIYTSVIGWLLIITIPIAGIILVIEIALRLFLPDINILTKIIVPIDDSRNYVLKQNTHITYQGLYEKHDPIVWSINQQGMRSDRHEKTNSDKYRILTYGDSETFGWSIELKDSWQRQMEKIDPRVEVLNFGIPGYNVVNIADHIEHTASRFNPDMLIYFFNKNDYYPAFNFNPVLSSSYAYLALRMILYRLSKDERKAWRVSPEGAEFMQTHIERIINLSNQYNAPLYILIMHWKYASPITTIADLHSDNVSVLNIEETLDKFPKEDAHLTEPAHYALANLLCARISNETTNSCIPSNLTELR